MFLRTRWPSRVLRRIGRAGSGATGWMSCGGRGGAGLARSPSGQTSARTLHGAGLGRSSAGLGPLRRTWTTSITLLLPPPAPTFRGVLSTRRRSLCEDCAPGSSRRGKTRSASDMAFSDMAFHGCARSPFGAAGFGIAHSGARAPSACCDCLQERRRRSTSSPRRERGRPARVLASRTRRRACRAGLGVGARRNSPGRGLGRASQPRMGFRRKSIRSPWLVSSAIARPTAIMGATAASIFCSGRCLAG